MPATDTALSNSTCPRCGASLRCGMAAGDAECWCVQLPHLMPVPAPDFSSPSPGSPAASCFCPACLKQITDERRHALSPPRD